jgi:hypothetical protein
MNLIVGVHLSFDWGLKLLTPEAGEGELWRRHRRVLGPAFNNSAYMSPIIPPVLLLIAPKVSVGLAGNNQNLP